MRTNPFVLDPFAVVYEAFTNLYPGKVVECYWTGPIESETGESAYGQTIFEDDGTISILISDGMLIPHAVEILAHELAHAAAGIDEGHGPAWEEAFASIHDEYNRINKEESGELFEAKE